jgi:hypothetical protein
VELGSNYFIATAVIPVPGLDPGIVAGIPAMTSKDY